MKAHTLPRRWEIAGLLLIVLLAAALRFYRLPDLPPGLHFDEGFKGVTARAILHGAPPRLFFESDMGEEPVAIYLVAAALALFGQDPWIIRLPSALVGTLTVPLVWWLGRELGRLHALPFFRRTRATGIPASRAAGSVLRAQILGLGAALVLALLYWHVSFSRIGMEPVLVPFFAALAFAALLRGLNLRDAERPAYRWFALAGLALGGSLYTYKAGYFVPILALLFVLYAAVTQRRFLRRYGRGLLLATAVALVVAAPISLYFVTHPANFLQRPGSVALLGGEQAQADLGPTLVDNLVRVLGMVFVRGDANPRSNLPGRPALDPFLALLFLIGLVRALVGALRARLAMALPLLWLGTMALPTLFADYAPHFGRAIGTTPALALLCALGLGWIVLDVGGWLGRFARLAYPLSSLILVVPLAAGLVFSAASTARAYFHTWGQSPDLFYAYDVGLANLSAYADILPRTEEVYLTPTSRKHYTLQFLSHHAMASFDGRAGLVFPPPGRAASVIVLLQEDETTLPTLQRLRPDGAITWTLNDSYGQPYAAVYYLPASESPAPPPEHPSALDFGDQVRLLGYDLEPVAGRRTTIVLHWQARAPLSLGYTAFVHLLGEYNPATGGPLWAGHDGQPVGGSYPTTAWEPGEVILDAHPIAIAAGAPAGSYQIEAGLYLLSTMTRLPVTDTAGNPLAGDAAILGVVEVEATTNQ
jgi:4-amino-4-deoxy-L-arabinose transferase-like glycosyltransferase